VSEKVFRPNIKADLFGTGRKIPRSYSWCLAWWEQR